MVLKQAEIRGLLAAWKEIMAKNKTMLIDLDSVVGDGDLGLTMSDGFAAASKAADEKDEADVGKLVCFAGKAMSTAVPSTMGTLMASGLMQIGKAMKGRTEIDDAGFVDMMEAYQAGVMNLGKAKRGEKTILDSLIPGAEALRKAVEEGKGAKEAAKIAAQAAADGAEATTTMLAVHGRAATRGEASRSLKDPGAVVGMLLYQAAADYLNGLSD